MSEFSEAVKKSLSNDTKSYVWIKEGKRRGHYRNYRRNMKNGVSIVDRVRENLLSNNPILNRFRNHD